MVFEEYNVLTEFTEESKWLDAQVFDDLPDLRNWHLIFFCFSGVLSIVVLLCCCFRFRIPRTKQEIEADYQRRIIARKFRERLAYIKNSEMDDMDLQKALDRIREDFKTDTQQAMGHISGKKSHASKKLKI